MKSLRLRDYFKKEYIGKALESYRVNIASSWPLEHKIDLYSFAKDAFDSDKPEDKKLYSFGRVYDNLVSYWQIFRPFSPSDCWSSERVFQFFKEELKDFGRSKNLQNISSEEVSVMKTSIEKMRSLKPLRGNEFPTMAASKLLHFFNPCLFPIYDSAVVEDIAFKTFWSEYRDFYQWNNPRYIDKGCEFLEMYILWAKYLFNNGSEEVMNRYMHFIKGSVEESYADNEIISEMNLYYAAAFENIFIGAAYIERNRIQ